MNDRFKFRVWDKGNEQYLNLSEVDYLTLDTENGGLIIGFLDELMTEMTYMPEKDMVVEQCTGLKDKNGNLIYEGDIVEITIFGSIGPNGGYVESDEIYKGTIVWDRDCFLAKTDTDMLLLPHSEDCIEIIGNIHEQAEQKD